MEPTRLSGLNLNALVALDALLSERNVTRAARRVGITQPAMSQSLARLRELFGDPLLARKGRTMVLTPRAEAMLLPLSDALLSVERALQLGMGFDAATSTRIFKIALTDLSVTMVLPSLLRLTGKRAPGVRVQAEPLSSARLSDQLSSGEIDLVIAVYLTSAGGLRTETLLVDDYVCLVRRGHALARRKRVCIDDYQAHRHVAYTPVGFVPRPMSEAVPGVASATGIRASVPYLLALPDVVRGTDLVATVPRRLLSAPIDFDGLVTLEAPPELPPVVHSQWWHPRFDSDPAHQWLREHVREAIG
ncbi:MAG: LysR family transcriptional regulator [Deltaproteobacteria bacterium]|nr:LysR family transcriptional regulator [Deltaproteobacteria bacterium]MBW2380907.1 LysR family transcriptional regulator [Deltaproteobacteria bacterium]